MEYWEIVAWVALAWVFWLTLWISALKSELKFQRTANDDNYRLLSSHDQYIVNLNDKVLEAQEKIEDYEEKLAIYHKTMESVLAQEVELTKGINRTNERVMQHITSVGLTMPSRSVGTIDPKKLREAVGLTNGVDCELTRVRTEEDGTPKINLHEKITKEDREKILEKLDRGDYNERCFG